MWLPDLLYYAISPLDVLYYAIGLEQRNQPNSLVLGVRYCYDPEQIESGNNQLHGNCS